MKKKFRFIVLLALGAFSLQTTVMAAELDSMRNYYIEQIEIKASRMNSKLKDLPQKVEIVTSEQLKSLPSENLAEILKRTTNLDIVQYPGIAATVGMRGFSPSAHSRSYTLLLINGKPSGTTNLASIIPSNIERIEIIKGPYATLYGSDAMGGVINIITKQLNEGLNVNASVEGGSFGYYNAEAFVSGGITKNIRAGIGATTMKQGKDYMIGKNNFLKLSNLEQLMLDKKSYGDTMLNSTYDLSNINAIIDWKINNKWNANAEAVYTFAKDVQLHGNYWGSYGQSKKEINRLNIYGSAERKSGGNTFTVSPYFTREKEPNYSDNTVNGFISFESNISEYGFKLQDQHKINKFNILAGVDYGVYDYKSNRFESQGTPAAPYKPNNKNSDAAFFTQIAYNTDKLNINAGARFDHFNYHIAANEALHANESENTYNTINPNLGLLYKISEKINLHSSFGTAFSVPDAYKTSGSYKVSVFYPEYNYTWSQSYVGNPDLKPEKSNTIDLGLRYNNYNEGISLDATYFYTRHFDKIIDYTLASGEKSYMNANTSIMDGIELDARYNFGVLFDNHFMLELYTNWTYLFDANFTQKLTGPAGADSIVTQDLQFVRKANGNFGLFFKNQMGLSCRLNSRYIGSRFEKDSFASLRPEISKSDYTTEGGYAVKDKMLKHPDYLVFDLSLNYTFKKHYNIGCTISNLLDENYSEKDGYNMFGRQVRFKIGYNL